MEYIEYASILILIETDLEELDNHLFMNGYNYGIDTKRNILFVSMEEVDYVEEILKDRGIVYDIHSV